MDADSKMKIASLPARIATLNTFSKSYGGFRSSSGWSLRPTRLFAASTSPSWSTVCESQTMATRPTVGSSSLKSPNRLAVNSRC